MAARLTKLHGFWGSGYMDPGHVSPFKKISKWKVQVALQTPPTHRLHLDLTFLRSMFLLTMLPS